jgi:hypothetical protein
MTKNFFLWNFHKKYLMETYIQRWAPALFSRSQARSGKKSAKKPAQATRFQSPTPLGRGKTKGLE